jgi:hypothetical protein
MKMQGKGKIINITSHVFWGYPVCPLRIVKRWYHRIDAGYGAKSDDNICVNAVAPADHYRSCERKFMYPEEHLKSLQVSAA